MYFANNHRITSSNLPTSAEPLISNKFPILSCLLCVMLRLLVKVARGAWVWACVLVHGQCTSGYTSDISDF